MSRVLVSFLGTARQEVLSDGYRRYTTAKYTFPDGDCWESSFVALALKHHFNIDRFILIGTPKSMWEEVYNKFTGNVDDVYAEIGDFCENANCTTAIEDFPHKDKIELALGNDSKVILVKYGLDAIEMEENSRKVLSIEQYLNPGDELYVDITHSFRSLPLLLMNSLIFLQNVCQKNISIKSISYGMLDITRELGYTKVVELKSILQLNDWISGAAEFMGSGNAYRIADLLESSPNASAEDCNAAGVLRNFSDVLNFNYFAAVRTQIDAIKRLKFDKMSVRGRLLIEPVVSHFLKKFDGCKLLSQYQFCLADYQFEQKHYAAVALCLSESIVSFSAECNDLDEKDQNSRNDAKNFIMGKCGGQQTLNNFFEHNYDLLKKRGAKSFSREELGLTTPANEFEICKLTLRKVYSNLIDFRNEVAHSLTGSFKLGDMLKQIQITFDVARPIIMQDARK